MPISNPLFDADDFLPWQPERNRANGWTPRRQRDFIAVLSLTGIVADAARAVGKTARSAYQLREKPGAEDFDRIWDRAQDHAAAVAEAEILQTVLGPDIVPVVRGGVVVGRRRRDPMIRRVRVLGALMRHERGAKERERRYEQREDDRQYRVSNRAWRAELDRRDAEKAKAEAKAQAEYDAELKRILEADARERRGDGPRVRVIW